MTTETARPETREEPAYLRPEQVAERFGVTPARVRQLLQSGALPGARIAGRWWTRVVDLDALFIRHQQGPTGIRERPVRGPRRIPRSIAPELRLPEPKERRAHGG